MDWTAGTITRRRSKTGHHENVPTVTFRLWPETFAELKRWRSEDPDLALVTRSGRPWVNRRFKDSDQIRQNYDRLSARLGIAKTLKHLRKTSASLLHNSEWSQYVQLFLGHSERTVAGRHYTAHDQAKFDWAVAWLRTQYDLA